MAHTQCEVKADSHKEQMLSSPPRRGSLESPESWGQEVVGGWESGAALCLSEECDLSPEGEGEHWKVTLWDLSCRQTTLAPGRTRSDPAILVKKEFSSFLGDRRRT